MALNSNSGHSARNNSTMARRDFMKVGLLGSTLLGAAGLMGSLQGCNSEHAQSAIDIHSLPLKVLREKDAIILAAVAPVVLEGNFPKDPDQHGKVLAQLILDIDAFVADTTVQTQQMAQQLFDLLYFSPTRIALGGLWSNWPEASRDDLIAFLENWRDSRFNTLRQGYILLTQLPTLAFYYQPENWNDQIYPGPPQHIPS